MQQNAVGFYWTLPVPWAGFTSLPEDVDAAAETSRTIRYQREVIRRYARDRHWALKEEMAFLELQPDRGRAEVSGALRKAKKLCLRHSALLLLVDFAVVHGWRGHDPLREAILALGIEHCFIAAPETLLVDGRTFDPFAHFAKWRAEQQQWTAAKSERQVAMASRAIALRDEGKTYAEIAALLNDAGTPSASGKPHSPESVRKALKAAGPK